MKSKLIITLIFIIFMFSVTSVCAADDGGNASLVLNDDNQVNSFKDLYYMTSAANETLNLENDFIFNENTDSQFKNGINLNRDNLTVNGNSHIIDAKNLSRIFNITAVNVTLANIQFKNAFHNNTGAVSYITGDKVKIINCTFSNNHAEVEAAAIYLTGNDAYIYNCSFINNSAKYTGAILIRSHNGRICDSYFENNTAQISAAAIGLAVRNNTSIENCVFYRNGAYNEGGAAIFVNKGLNTRIINSTFLDNFAHYYGGAIFWSYGTDGSVVNSKFINNTATEKGGAIYHIGDNITLTDNFFRDNRCVNGSAIYLNNGTNNVLSGNIVISNGIYINNIGISKIYDSIILDKIFSNNSTVIYSSNWFGNIKDNFNESLNENADNWLYLNASSDRVMIGEDTSVKFQFDQFNNSQSFDLPQIALNLSAENLILANDTLLAGDSVNSRITDYGAYINASFQNVTFAYVLPIAELNIFADNLMKYYGDAQRFIVRVLDDKANPISNKSVKITINGIEYPRITDENGSATIAINLNSGEYDVTVSADNITVNSTVSVLSTVDGDNLVKVFKNESQYYARFKDSKGNLLRNTKVSFNINGIYYNRTTDDKGSAKLNINLIAGKYVITAFNTNTGEMHSNNITVLSRFFENSDLVKYYRNDSQYVVRVMGDDGNPIGPGEVVTFNINGVLYNRTTNESGYVKLNINLNPGDYIITAEYKGCMVSNIITVKSVLFADDLKMHYNDGSKFKATLLNGQGNSYPNQRIEFNVNGIIYSRTTDSSGEAKMDIHLMPGEYIMTSSYNGYSTSNKITVS